MQTSGHWSPCSEGSERFLALSDHLGEAEWLGAFSEWSNEGEENVKPPAKKTRRPRKK